MAKVTYVPQNDADASFVTWGGVRLEANKAVDVPDDGSFPIDKAKENPWFKVTGAEKPKAEPKAVEVDQGDDPEENAKLRAKARELGIDAHHRLGNDKLKLLISNKEKADAEAKAEEARASKADEKKA